MEMTKRLKYIPDPNKFDLRTHEWDSQGRLVSTNHYRLHNQNGNNYYERPVNSGNLWFENNQPAGRVEYTFGDGGKVATKKFHFDAEHKAFTPAPTGAEKLHYELEQAKVRNEQLAAELAAIKAETATKATQTVPVQTNAMGKDPETASKVAPPTLTKRENK